MGMWDASTRELSKTFLDDVQEWVAVDAEELVSSTDQSLSPSADISVAVGIFTGDSELIRWTILTVFVFRPLRSMSPHILAGTLLGSLYIL
ncbi:uncharacterized protein ARMOST_11444 [Armillaria ostoyae]|uniref:Uncharacterized protein n=1 Tax=Armillaria ostoyae TaxID=47428 RepID=A0A284RH55_ARMOS|nr:uncharacterized protein ARMOST_11444 [Armillaria ostoyae]